MNKYLYVFLGTLIMFALCSCSSNEIGKPDTTSSEAVSQTASTVSRITEEIKEYELKDGNVIVPNQKDASGNINTYTYYCSEKGIVTGIKIDTKYSSKETAEQKYKLALELVDQYTDVSIEGTTVSTTLTDEFFDTLYGFTTRNDIMQMYTIYPEGDTSSDNG